MKLHHTLAGAFTVALLAVSGGAALSLSLPSSPDLGPFTTIFTAIVSPHVASMASVAGLHPGLKVVDVDGFATAGDGGRRKIVYDLSNACGAGGHPAASTPAAPTTCINSAYGSAPAGAWDIDWASVGNVANLKLFGAQCIANGGAAATGDTAAVLAAFATGHDVYVPSNVGCAMLQPAILPNSGQRIHGDGSTASKFYHFTQWGGSPGTFTGSISNNTLSVTALGTGANGIATAISTYTVITDAGVNGANGLNNPTYVTAVNASNPSTCSSASPCTYTLSGSGSYTVVVNGTAQASSTVASETMNAAPLGVITLGSSAQEVRGIGFSFSQPASPANRAAITTYPAALMARQAGTIIDDFFAAGGTTCVDMGGNINAGNSYLTLIETGCFDYGIRIDGSIDTVHIDKHHSFPFQMSPKQQAVFERTTNPSVAIDLGRMDDYAISNGLCFLQTCINYYIGAQGGAFGSITGYDFDTAINGILMQSPNASAVVTASGFTSGSNSQHGIYQTAGKIIVTGSGFFAAAPTQSVIYQGGTLSITGSQFDQLNNDAAAISANCPQNGNARGFGLAAAPCALTLSNNTILRDTGTAFNNPWLSSQGYEVIVGSGNAVTPTTAKINGSSTPPAVLIAKDTLGNRWFGNSSPGWNNFVARAAMPNSLTATSGGGKYFGN